ncbi:uncharacterized protein LOC134250822 [Saccostrea cucullata]|uniref:uncharacterized protein LOC134250822 n=1 Tax=Saccostrea cuccullata TaxID=36930 RepID=UPI002ED49A9B
MAEGDFNPGWTLSVLFFVLVYACGRYRDHIIPFFRHLCNACFELCYDWITSLWSAACERLSFCNTEETDIDHVSTQSVTLELLSDQSIRIDRPNVRTNDEPIPIISVPPPSYEIVCDSDRAESENFLTPTLSLEVLSNQSTDTEEHHNSNDVENPVPIISVPPPSYEIVCDSDRAESENFLTPTLSLEILSNQSTDTEEHHNSNDVENLSINSEPPPSYEIAVIDLSQPPPSYNEAVK